MAGASTKPAHLPGTADPRFYVCSQVEELLRKLFFVAIGSLAPSGSSVQLASAIAVSAWAHVLHAAWRPFHSYQVNLLQHVSLLLTFCYFLGALLIHVRSVEYCVLRVLMSLRSLRGTFSGRWLAS